MQGVYLNKLEDGVGLGLVLKPAEVDLNSLTDKSLLAFIKENYAHYYLSEEKILNAYKSLQSAKKMKQDSPIEQAIGEARDASVKFIIAPDKMSASLEITTAYGGKSFSTEDLLSRAKSAGIVRGLSRKRIASLAELSEHGKPGDLHKLDIAKGLPPKNGKPSKLVPLVPNALERALRPQSVSLSRVDMRDLGEIFSVKPGTELLERRKPGKGRKGYNVMGEELESTEGEWLPFKPGEGTYISPKNENLLLAEVSGMPKFQEGKMWVDDVFTSKGVNVGSGNINYDGAVVVNGDVTEKMKIIASGDVTINGFVESAYIEAGGDIIITQGAMGKHDEANDGEEYSARLIAKGSIHIQHGQGLDISCKGNVTVGKQLAYSRIHCGGEITIGPIENPNGNIFACEVVCEGAIRSGVLGAVSGSHLFVDFSEGFNAIEERIESVDEVKKLLRQHIERHTEKMEIIRARTIPNDLKDKVADLFGKFRDERCMFQQIMATMELLDQNRHTYLNSIGLDANKQMYPGVVVKLNNRTWKADREYGRAKIRYADHQWHYDPM